MPSRRQHAKSRHGCLACKLRKVKCDARTPICSNCLRREERCSFLSSSTFELLTTSDTVSRSRLPSLASTPVVPTTLGTLNGAPDALRLDLQTLELMHHFSTIVCFTLSKNSLVLQLWQNQVPRDALSYPFLLHWVMAASALHLADAVPTRRAACLTMALRHHGTALSTYKPMLQDITEANCEPLCAGGRLLVLFMTAYSLLPGAVGVSPGVKGLLELAELIKGGQFIHQAVDSWAGKGDQFRQVTEPGLKGWNSHNDHNNTFSRGLSEAIEMIEETVRTIAVTQIETEDVKSVYLSTLDMLVKTLKTCYLNPDHPELVVIFMVEVDPRFIDLWRSMEHLALVILAYYGIVLNLVKENWWAGNWGLRLVQDVYDSLDASSRSLVQIPMEQVGLTDPIDRSVDWPETH